MFTRDRRSSLLRASGFDTAHRVPTARNTSPSVCQRSLPTRCTAIRTEPNERNGRRGRAQTMKTILAVMFASTLAACAPPTPEQQVIDDAAEALGGASRIQNLKALTIQGTGLAP